MRTPLLSPARQAELLARYPVEETAALAAAFGLTARQVITLASNNSVKKATGDGRTSAATISQQVLAAVAAAGDAGLCRAQAIAALPALLPTVVSDALHSLTNRGLLHRAGQRGSSRWFTRKEWAADHDAQHFANSAARVRASCMPGVAIKHHTAPAHLPGEAIVPAGLRPVECPTVPSPAERLAACEPGLFSNLRPGQYIDAQPRSWVEAITTMRKAA